MIQGSLYQIVFTSSEVRRQVKKPPEGGLMFLGGPGRNRLGSEDV